MTPELGYRNLPGGTDLKSFWCDFAGSRKYGQGVGFILEAKFLKRKAENMAKHLAADIVRLSLPPGDRLMRLFLLAGKSEHFPKTKTNFLFERIFRLDRKRGCDIRLEDAFSNADFMKTYPTFQWVLDLKKNSARPKLSYVECRAVEETSIAEGAFRVMIWSVKRARE